MHITVAQMERAYELLRSSPPFSRWRMPQADDVEFHATVLKRDRLADCENLGGAYRIRICVQRHATLGHLLISMAHEMCHIYTDTVAPQERSPHGKHWKIHARRVCKAHGWDFKTF